MEKFRMIRFLILAVACVSFSCTMDKGDKAYFEEFGLVEREFTVDAVKGDIEINLLSNQEVDIYFEEGASWAKLSSDYIEGDGYFWVDYEDNPGLPRMAVIMLETRKAGLIDTIWLKQRGSYDPRLELPSATLILPGSTSGTSRTEFLTNISVDEITIDTVYTSAGTAEWIRSVNIVDGFVEVAYDSNPEDALRTASVTFSYMGGWGELITSTLYLMQQTRNDVLGNYVDFTELRGMAEFYERTTIEDYIIITGHVISDKASMNAGENPQLTETSIDYTVCEKTFYIQNLEGTMGFCVQTATVGDNIFNRYDKVEILLYGAQIYGYDDPDRFFIEGVTSTMVVAQQAGTASSVVTKEKYLNELVDTDIFTHVTLKDCEFPVRKGSLTPLHEGYTLGDAQGRTTKYPRLVRDINGDHTYLVTNTTCPYRRDGRKLPYGSGKLTGVLVHERFPQMVWGDADDEDFHGNIGRYQIRHMAYEDIAFHDSETFSELLTEYRYIKDKAKDPSDGFTYWYPTHGNNGRFTHQYGCDAGTSWNYLGPIGTAKGTPPFNYNLGNVNGLGIILEDGTDYDINNSAINEDGKGQEAPAANSNSWKVYYWRESGGDKFYSWRIEFSTLGIQTDHLSMQFTVHSNRTSPPRGAIYWKAEWSLTGDLDRDSDWNYIDSYMVPDFPVYAGQKPWHSAGFRQLDFPLPLTMLGHEKVYIRLTPLNRTASTATEFAGGTVPSGGSSGNGMDYFAIRYNK